MPSSYVIGEYFEEFIKQQLAEGRYASASEVIREGLRVLEDQEELRRIRLERLRAEIQKGIDSGDYIPAEEVFAELRAKYQNMAKEREDVR